MGPVIRTAARVLPVSPEGQVLLLQCQDPARPGDLHWISIGGAVDPGESRVEAALRELREETGIEAEAGDLTEPIHHGDYRFSWDGVEYLNRATVYAFPCDRRVEVSLAGLEPGEVGNVLGAAWWTPDELAADGTAANLDLPDVMSLAIAAVRDGRPLTEAARERS
jgi:8-oxo-dGTP pyrophosphatase MutT (NUDIX family)